MRKRRQPEWSTRSFCRTLFQFKWRALAFGGLTVLLAIVVLIVSPRTYTSEAKVLLRVGRESVGLDPTATTAGQVIGYDRSLESEVNSAIEVITSRAIMERVVDERRGEQPFASPLEREKVIRKLNKNVTVWSPKTTSVIVLEAEGRSPEVAQQTVQDILDVYVEEHMRVYRTSGSYQFFQEQAEMLRERLEGAVARLRDAKNEFGFVSLEDRRSSLQKHAGDLEATIRDTESEITASTAKVSAMRASLDQLPSGLVSTLAGGDQSINNLREQLFKLQTREQELISNRTPDHPEVIAIRRQVHELEEILNSEKVDPASAMSTVVLQEDAKLKSFEARRLKLIEQHGMLMSELQTLNQQELEIERMRREVELLAANHRTYSENLEQSRVDQALKTEGITNVSVVQPASFEAKPASPKIGRTLAIACLAGLFGGLALALLSAHMDQTLRCGDDVERCLGLPLLVSFPDARSRDAGYGRRDAGDEVDDAGDETRDAGDEIRDAG